MMDFDSILDGIKAQMAHAKAVNRKKNWDDDDPESAASGVNTPITGNFQYSYYLPYVLFI